jgi:hypothetical protein
VPEHAAAAPRAQEPGLRADLIGFAGAVSLIVALPVASALARVAHPATAGGVLVAAMSAADPPPRWQLAAHPSESDWSPRFPGANVLRRIDFADAAGRRIEVLAVTYAEQRDGAELVGESSSLLGDRLEARAEGLIDGGAGVFRETEVADRKQARSLLWWRYEIAGRPLVSAPLEQLWFGIDALFSRPPAQLIALRASCGDDCAVARGALTEFLASSGVH